MEFTLQQARRLEDSFKYPAIKAQFVDVRSYDGDIARGDIIDAEDDLEEEILYKLAINKIRFKIRHLINIQNMECGVSNILCRREGMYSDIKLLETLSDKCDDRERQVDYISKNPSEVRTVSAVRQSNLDWVSHEVSLIKEELSNIKEELAILNTTVTIKLDHSDTQFLQENGLV